MEEDGVFIEVTKLGRNSRRIRCKVAIRASLDDVWRVMTGYDKMAEFLPCVSVSKIVERRENFARVNQVGQQDLVFGLKFNSNVTMEYYERDVEVFDSGKRRDLEFKLIESDFQIYEGKWSVEQLNKEIAEDEHCEGNEGCETILSYVVDVKPKLWLPVQLLEGKLSKVLSDTHSCIRGEVMRLIQNAQPCQ